MNDPFYRALVLLAALGLGGCGRTHLLDDGTDAGFDAGGVSDAGTPDAGTTDAGPPPPQCPPPPPNSGRIWGTTPLGTIDFQNVWIGTEGPWSHSCPHVTVVGSPGPAIGFEFVVDFLYARPPVLGATKGVATLTLAGKTARIDVTGNVTRADGLTMSASPVDGWRTSLTFGASDGGWTVQGVVTEVPDCFRATWFCL